MDYMQLHHALRCNMNVSGQWKTAPERISELMFIV